MRDLPFNKPPIEVGGLLFHVTTLMDAIPGAPLGIWIENSLAAKNPVLRERSENGVGFKFVVIDSVAGTAPGSPARLLHHITSQSMPESEAFGNYEPVELYAEVPPVDVTVQLINEGLSSADDPERLTALAQQMLRDGYRLSCEFVNILRQDYGQYWLRPPADLFHWCSVRYYSKTHQRWFHIGAGEDFATALLQRKWGDESEATHRPFILLGTIGEKHLKGLGNARSACEPTFADEMVATALIELKNNRLRSAIIHAFIAFESVAKRGLESLLQRDVQELQTSAVLEAVSREVSTVTLGKVVWERSGAILKERGVDWDIIGSLYTTRNMIVHRGQRRMPEFDMVKRQVLEVRVFVINVQQALAQGRPSGC